MATVRPLQDRVLVRVIAAERKTSGGVILPDQARERTDRGLVVAAGPGAPQMEPLYFVGSDGVDPSMPVTYRPGHRPMEIGEGQVVLFSPYAGSKVTVGQQDYLLLREHDILGVLEGVEVTETEEGELLVEEQDARWPSTYREL